RARVRGEGYRHHLEVVSLPTRALRTVAETPRVLRKGRGPAHRGSNRNGADWVRSRRGVRPQDGRAVVEGNRRNRGGAQTATRRHQFQFPGAIVGGALWSAETSS